MSLETTIAIYHSSYNGQNDHGLVRLRIWFSQTPMAMAYVVC